jgi:DNA-binding response OmpR family regulator
MTTIVIIEDDQVISQMYRMKFESDGFEVHVASERTPMASMLVKKTRPESDPTRHANAGDEWR